MFLKNLSKTLLVTTLMILFMVSCEDNEYYPDDFDYEALSSEIESLTNDVYTADLAELDMRGEDDVLMQRFRGKHKCFKFVYPLTLVYPDGTEELVEDKESFREAMHEWKEDNPDVDEKPVIKMPFDVILRDETVITIETEEQLLALQEDCWQSRPNVPRFKLCFDPVFPVDVKYPDGTIEEVADMEALKALLKGWKVENPDSDERPEIVFPIQIINTEGDTVSVQNMEELREQLKDCLENMRKKGKKNKKDKKDKKDKKGNKGNKGNKGG